MGLQVGHRRRNVRNFSAYVRADTLCLFRHLFRTTSIAVKPEFHRDKLSSTVIFNSVFLDIGGGHSFYIVRNSRDRYKCSESHCRLVTHHSSIDRRRSRFSAVSSVFKINGFLIILNCKIHVGPAVRKTVYFATGK